METKDKDIQYIDRVSHHTNKYSYNLINNITIIKLDLDIELCENDISDVTGAGEAEKVNSARTLHKEHIVDFTFGLDTSCHLGSYS